MNLSYGINLLWSTPIYKTSITKEVTNQLVTEVMTVASVIQPANDDNSNLIEEIPLLKQVADEKYAEFLYDVYDIGLEELDYNYRAWLTGSTGGYNMDVHNHSGAPFVSVFYLLAEEKNAGGEIVLNDPRSNANRGYRGSLLDQFAPVVHQPKTGDVLIFPGFVYHSVRRYDSQLRLAVPVDMFIKG